MHVVRYAKVSPGLGRHGMLSAEVRSAMTAAGLTLAGTGHPFGWVLLAAAIANDIVESR